MGTRTPTKILVAAKSRIKLKGAVGGRGGGKCSGSVLVSAGVAHGVALGGMALDHMVCGPKKGADVRLLGGAKPYRLRCPPPAAKSDL